jgi:hypothetical protein
MARHRHPSLESVGTHAVHAVSRRNDNTHTAVLKAIDELLAIGADRPPAPEPPAAERRRTPVDATA